jgi:hypothetical protein
MVGDQADPYGDTLKDHTKTQHQHNIPPTTLGQAMYFKQDTSPTGPTLMLSRRDGPRQSSPHPYELGSRRWQGSGAKHWPIFFQRTTLPVGGEDLPLLLGSS